MQAAQEPRWRRRRTARPGEIVAAAFAEFADKGFAAARLQDIAARAGVSKGALYLYFETKTDLFRAVVRDAVAPNLDGVRQMAETFSGSFPELLTMVLGRIGTVAQAGGVGAMAKMVIGESRNFPDLAKVWHDQVVSQGVAILAAAVARAQARGEVAPGDPRLYAFQLLSPVVVGVLWAEVFVPAGAEPLPMEPLLSQHAHTLARGMMTGAGRGT